jgi:hypothetical protein
MQRALEVDQVIITDEGLHYVDNVDDEAATDEEKQAIINAAKQPAKEDKDVPVPTEKS